MRTTLAGATGAMLTVVVAISCGKSDETGTGGSGAYGTPYAHYEASGTVVRQDDAAPIEGIQVRLDVAEAVASSDAAGSWSLDLPNADASCTWSSCSVTATDIDGDDHGGTFQTTTVSVVFERTAVGSGWDSGTWSISDVAIEMVGTDGGAGGHAGNAGAGGAGGESAGGGTVGAGGIGGHAGGGGLSGGGGAGGHA